MRRTCALIYAWSILTDLAAQAEFRVFRAAADGGKRCAD